jgi:hypothetical protein
MVHLQRLVAVVAALGAVGCDRGSGVTGQPGGLVAPLVVAPTTSMASVREGHAMVELFDGRIAVFGGRDSGGVEVGVVELYDPLAGTWSLGPTLSTPRFSASATLLLDGRVLVAGGAVGTAGAAVAVTELFDPTTNTLTAGPALPGPRFGHSATRLPDGDVLVVGGFSGGSLADACLYRPTPDGRGAFSTTGSLATSRGAHLAVAIGGDVLVIGGQDVFPVASAELWSAATGTFAAAGALASARSGPVGGLLPDGTVLVVGGFDGSRALATSERWSPTTRTFTNDATMASVRMNHGAAGLPAGGFAIVGGRNERTSYASTAEQYSPTTRTFTSTSGASQREAPVAVPLGAGRILATGGVDPTTARLNTVELIDAQTTTTTTGTALPAALARHTITLLADGRVLVVGGTTDGATARATASLYDPAADAFTAAGALATARIGHAATLLEDGRVLVSGGNDGTRDVATVELFDPATSTFVAGGALSNARADHTSTLLPTGEVLVVGGSSTTFERFHVPTRASVATGALPAARREHAAVRLPGGDVLVVGGLVGGVASPSVLRYATATGTWLTAPSLGVARRRAAALQLADGAVFVVGGLGSAGAPLGAAERLVDGGAAWAAAGTLLTARSEHAAVLTPSGRALVVGGRDGANAFPTSIEAWDPVRGAFVPASGLASGRGRAGARATLLADGRIVVVGGAAAAPVAFVDRIDEVGPTADRPTLAGPASLGPPTATATLTGTGFVAPWRADGATLRLVDGEGSMVRVAPDALSATSLTLSTPGLQPGFYRLFVATGGPVGGRVVRIEPRPPAGVIPVVAPTSLVADGASRATVEIGVVVDARGVVVADGTLVTVASSGGILVVDDAAPAIDGVQVATSFGRAQLSLQSTSTLGEVTVVVTAVLGDATGSASLSFVPGPATGTIAVAASTTTLVADGGATANLDVGPVRDAQGNVVADGDLVAVTAAAGTLVGVDASPAAGLQLALSAGRASFSLRAPTVAGGTTVRVTSVGGDASGAVGMTFVAGPPASTPLAAVPTSLPADGTSTSTVTAGPVLDAQGNVVADGTVFTASTTGGELVGVDVDVATPGLQRATQAGRLTFSLRAPPSSGTARVAVAARDGGVGGFVDVAFVPAPADGPFDVTASPTQVAAGGAPVEVVAGPLTNAAGTALEDGALFTVTTTGAIVEPDLDANLQGTQLASRDGVVVAHVHAGTVAGAVDVDVAAVVGRSSGSTTITVVAGPPDHLTVQAPSSIVAGVATAIAIVAVDAFDNRSADVAVPVCVAVSGDGGGAPGVDGAGLVQAVSTEPSRVCGLLGGDEQPGFVAVRDTLVEDVVVQVASTGLPGSGNPDATVIVPVVAAGGDHLVVDIDGASAVACGQVLATARLFDAFDNRARPTANLLVRLSASADVGAATILQTTLERATEVPAAEVLGFLPSTGEATAVVTLDDTGLLELSASATLPSSSTPATARFVVGPVDAAASTVVALAEVISSGTGSAPVEVVPVDACGVRLGPGRAVVMSSSYGTLTPVEDVDGTYRATFRTAADECNDEPAVISASVDDVPLLAMASVRVTCSSVGEPPVIDRAANAFGARERPYVYDDDRRVSATGTPPLRYRLVDGPDGVFVNEVTGRIDWFPLEAGRFRLEVAATNPAGEDRYSFAVDVSPEPPPPPVVTVLAVPPTGGAPLAVSFDGSQSTASPGASILVSRWDFGDGSGPSYTERTTHEYLRPGGYVARLQVADSLGGTAAGSAQIAVTDEGLVPPLARIVASATEGADALEVTLSCDCTPGSAPINAYLWELGDGTVATGSTVTHVFSPGAHEVRLVVTDENGLSAIDRRQIVVLAGGQLPPEVFAQASPVAGEAPLTVTLSADAGDLDGQVGDVQWEFSDGQRLAGDVVERTFAEPGLYVATATVVDDDGLEASVSIEVQVTGGGDVPPVVVSVPSTTARVGEPWTYDDDGAPAARGDRPLLWGLGKSVDGELFGAPPGATVDRPTGRVAWTPQAPGTYPVVLVVENAAGIAAQQFDVVVVGDGPGGDGPGGDGASAGCNCGANGAPVPLWALIVLGGRGLLRRRRTHVR